MGGPGPGLSPTRTYLKDSAGVVRYLTVSNAGAYGTSAPVLGQVGPSSIPLYDTATGTVFSLTLLTNGALHIDPTTGFAQNNIPILSPGGVLFGIVVTNNAIATIVLSSCQFSLGDALTALGSRLYDPTMQFWSRAEMILYIREAMRTWNALTGYWRSDFLFNAQQGVSWYDITDTTAMPNTLRPLTLSTIDLFTMIEYHLLEPAVGGGTWTGSAQFALSDIQGAVLRRRDETMGVSGCMVTRRIIQAGPGRIFLTVPATVIDIRRIAFIPSTGFGSPSVLWQDDSWSWQQFEVGQTTKPPGIPSTYSVSTQPVFSFDVDTRVNVVGTYEVLTVDGGGTAGLPSSPSTLLVPDDWSWVIKWGALSELLNRESNAKDALRAKYAEARYRQGQILLSSAPAILGLRSNNIPVQIDAVKSADEYQTGWQGQAQSAPGVALVAGLNLIALSPAPDAGTYSMTATVVENAPAPSASTDCLLLAQDAFEVILDYAQHLACFKMGGEEFLATMPLYQRFMEQAALYASKVAEMGEFSKIIYRQSQLESAMNPRYDRDLEEAQSG